MAGQPMALGSGAQFLAVAEHGAVLAEAQAVFVGKPMLIVGFLMLILASFLAWPSASVLACWLTWRLPTRVVLGLCLT